MNHKRFYQTVSSLIALALLIISWITLLSSTTIAAEDQNQHTVFLPVVNRPLCDFPQHEPGYFFEHGLNEQFSQALGSIRPHETAWGCFSATDDINDYYYIYLPGPSHIYVSLTNIPPGHDYDLVLYDKYQKRLANSIEPGNHDEEIRFDNMSPGRYYVQVHNADKTAAAQTYRLNVIYIEEGYCDDLAIIQEMVPQVKDEKPDPYPFYSEIVNFGCRQVFDTFHSGHLALRMEYEAGNSDGYWGIATDGGFDATQFGGICLWAYAEEGTQSFSINLRDKTETERASSPQIVFEANKWKQFCVPLSDYSAQGVQLDNLENVNVHFHKALGNATIWVDDIKFSPPCNDRSITAEVFPQLKDRPDQYPIVAENDAFQCQVVEDISVTEPIALRLKYAAGDVGGYWGVATEDGFNATTYNNICLWAYAEHGRPAFTINLKDIPQTEKESGPQIIADTNRWEKFCVPLSHYSAQGVLLGKIENVNVNFSKDLGNATIWIDDLRYE